MKTSVADTSLKAYQNNEENLETLKAKVFDALEKFFVEHQFWPTYNELHKYMMRNYEGINFNTQIQPRLTNDLVQEGKVRRHVERECLVSSEEINTWKKVNL